MVHCQGRLRRQGANAMRFNMNRAWNEAVRLLRANKELLALLAGIFIFLPSLATYLIVPQTMALPSDLDTNNPMPQINAYFAEFGPYIIALSVAQYVGLLAMVALFARRRPQSAMRSRTDLRRSFRCWSCRSVLPS